MKLKSIFSDLLVTIITLVAAFAAVTAATAFQDEPPGSEQFAQAYSEPYSYPLAYAYNTTRVSVSSDGVQANDFSWLTSISADGRYVSFTSYADNLVTGDTNGTSDIFVHNRQTGETTRVSVASDGSQADGNSQNSTISADGRYVVFASYASNLVVDDTNEAWDVFVHDRQTGATTRVSISSSGAQAYDSSFGHSISADGRYVAFSSRASNLVTGDTNGTGDVFVHDRQTGETMRVSVASDGAQADQASGSPKISADGRYVAFLSQARNLVTGDTNWNEDIFVHDRQSGETTRVSIASDGSQADGDSQYSTISADGRYVAFGSYASNLVADDTNEAWDVFVHDRQTGATTRVSVASNGSQLNDGSNSPSISGDGRYVAFSAFSPPYWKIKIFIHDRQIGKTRSIPGGPQGFQPTDSLSYPSISANGHAIAFSSNANNLVVGDTNFTDDVFVYDKLAKAAPANKASDQPPSLALSWNDDDDESASYEYCLGTISGECNHTGWTSTGTNTSVMISELELGTNYHWQLRAVNQDGNIEADSGTWWSFTTVSGIPGSVQAASAAPQDGWILEKTAGSKQGGKVNRDAQTLQVGDDNNNRQYRSILSFDTSGIPANAVITKVTLEFKYAGMKNKLPFGSHGNLLIDIRRGAFSNNVSLQAADFNAIVSKAKVLVFKANDRDAENWYRKEMNPNHFKFINRDGLTQFRLRFAMAHNNNFKADFLSIFSGEALDEANRPQLIIEYYVPVP